MYGGRGYLQEEPVTLNTTWPIITKSIVRLLMTLFNIHMPYYLYFNRWYVVLQYGCMCQRLLPTWRLLLWFLLGNISTIQKHSFRFYLYSSWLLQCYSGFYGIDCSNQTCPGSSCYYDDFTFIQVIAFDLQFTYLVKNWQQSCYHACQAGYNHTDNDVYIQDISKIPCSHDLPGEVNGICDGFGHVQCAPPFIGILCSFVLWWANTDYGIQKQGMIAVRRIVHITARSTVGAQSNIRSVDVCVNLDTLEIIANSKFV